MSGKIALLIAFQFGPGHAQEMKEICRSAVDLARAEEGTLSFDQYFSPDDSAMLSLEVYRDCDALMAHLGNASENVQRVEEISKVTRFEVFGDADGRVREAFEPLNPQYFSHQSGI